MKPEEFSAVVEAFSGVRAVDTAARIRKTDAEFTFPAFHRTSRNVVRMMEQAGLEDIETYSFRADGSTKYGDWTVPRAWDVRKARLQIEQKKGFTTIADRNRHFCSVIMYSAPTPGGKTYECSIVQEKDRRAWQGNLVFADNPGKLSHKRLAQGGAVGIVTDYMPEWKYCRTREDVYDTVLWNNSCFAPANRYGLIGFQLSPREGDRIRALFSRKKSKIRARALVDSKLYDGTIDFVTGLLPGQQYEAEEVGVFAHLFEPGANDNASGCALGLESLRVMKELAEKGDLKPLKRPVRLCYTFEVFGTLAFFESFPDKMKRIKIGRAHV